jgi:protein-tyrosine phosphatase
MGYRAEQAGRIRQLRLRVWRRLHAARVTIQELGIPTRSGPDSPDTRYRILFVCKGNICRSPLALGILRERLAKAGLMSRVFVDSAGTSGVNHGKRPDPRARSLMLRRRQSIGDHRAREFRLDDFERFDLILVMDETNRAHVLNLARTDADRRQVRLLSEYTDGAPIQDPVMGAQRDFVQVFAAIDRACEALVAQLVSNPRVRSAV